jgi:hypothetical protein
MVRVDHWIAIQQEQVLVGCATSDKKSAGQHTRGDDTGECLDRAEYVGFQGRRDLPNHLRRDHLHGNLGCLKRPLATSLREYSDRFDLYGRRTKSHLDRRRRRAYHRVQRCETKRPDLKAVFAGPEPWKAEVPVAPGCHLPCTVVYAHFCKGDWLTGLGLTDEAVHDPLSNLSLCG